jgi:hypothetical protein
MNIGDLLRRYGKALELIWKSPPAEVGRKARMKPSGAPIPPPPESSSISELLPSDVRSSSLAGAPGTVISRSFPGLDVSLVVTPPTGDALWVIEGRGWRSPPGAGPIRVVLAQSENVIAERSIAHGARFRFEELLGDEWRIEFHLGETEVYVLQSPRS